MPTPEFVLALREKIGTAPLWLSGVTAVVLRGNEVLLVRRSDNGEWTPVTGIIDPGEEPADAAVREIAEEADIRAVPQRLVWVHVLPTSYYDNGDETQYLDLVFRLGYLSGEPYPVDGENTEAAWFALDQLPPMSADMRARIQAAVADDEVTRFEFSPPQ